MRIYPTTDEPDMKSPEWVAWANSRMALAEALLYEWISPVRTANMVEAMQIRDKRIANTKVFLGLEPGEL